jgi:hypothetical protein
MAELQTTLSHLQKLQEYRLERQHIFQSAGALDWFVRTHRSRLIDAGALMLLAGSWHVNPSAFDITVLEIGQQAAKGRA